MNKAKEQEGSGKCRAMKRPIHGGRKLNEIRMNKMDGMLVLIISYRH